MKFLVISSPEEQVISGETTSLLCARIYQARYGQPSFVVDCSNPQYDVRVNDTAMFTGPSLEFILYCQKTEEYFNTLLVSLYWNKRRKIQRLLWELQERASMLESQLYAMESQWEKEGYRGVRMQLAINDCAGDIGLDDTYKAIEALREELDACC